MPGGGCGGMPGCSGIDIGPGTGGGAPCGGAPGGGICGSPGIWPGCGICGGGVCGGGAAMFISAFVMASRWSITPVF